MASSGLFPQPLWINVRGERERHKGRPGSAALSRDLARAPIRMERIGGTHETRSTHNAAMPGYVWGFAAFAVPFVATPGASTAVVLRNSVGGGVRSGIATALGVNAGSIAYGLLTAFGLSLARAGLSFSFWRSSLRSRFGVSVVGSSSSASRWRVFGGGRR